MRSCYFQLACERTGLFYTSSYSYIDFSNNISLISTIIKFVEKKGLGLNDIMCRSSAYATETSDHEITQLPPATQLESHVTTLSTTILEASCSALTPSSSSADASMWLSQSQIGTPRRSAGASQERLVLLLDCN